MVQQWLYSFLFILLNGKFARGFLRTSTIPFGCDKERSFNIISTRRKHQSLEYKLFGKDNEARDIDDERSLVVAKETALSLQQQAKLLREEARAARLELNKKKKATMKLQNQKITNWMDSLFLVETSLGDDSHTELLSSVEQVAAKLRDERFSQEQVQEIFGRLVQERPTECRSNPSVLMELLVDACGQLDCLERDENPNKRWSGKVERDLRRKLFALDWGIELEETPNSDEKSSRQS